MAEVTTTNIDLSNILSSGSVLPYDQPEIEAVMKKILYDKGISDVMFEGSNISQLSSVVSYVIASLNVNTAINLQETILPLATKRMNAQFGARQLGYEPHVKKAYRYNITLSPMYDESKVDYNGNIDTMNQVQRSIDLVQNTAFQSGDKTYYYKGPTISNIFFVSNYMIQRKNDVDTEGNRLYDDDLFYKEIEVIEGTLIEYANDPTLRSIVEEYTDTDGLIKAKQEYLVPFHNVEDDGLQVFVETIDYTQAPVNGVRPKELILREKSKHFLIDDTFTEDQNKFVRMDNIILDYPIVYFQYSDLGNPVAVGDNILINVFQTLGELGVAEKDFIVVDTVANQLFYVEQPLTALVSRGTNVEPMDSIKANATVFNNTANRAVTKLDYQAITKRHAFVKETEAWGGEDEENPNSTPADEPFLGHVWISTVPYYEKDYVYSPQTDINLENYTLAIGLPTDNSSYDWYQSDDKIENIIDYLNYYKIMTMQIHHRQPMYLNFDFLCDIVKYDMTKSKTEINKNIFTGIEGYFADQIEHYDGEYLNSNLQRVLDTILSYQSGIGFEVNVQGSLFKGMIDEITEKMQVTLDYPFENMFTREDAGNAGYLESTLLPNIDTLEFGKALLPLTVDYTLLEPLNVSEGSLSTPILYDSVISGTYTVNNEDSVIDIEFTFTEPQLEEIFGTYDPEAGPPTFEEYAYMDIQYPYTSSYNNNIPFTKNTIPRLRKVEFKNN